MAFDRPGVPLQAGQGRAADDKGKISRKAVVARLKELGTDAEDLDERQALEEYLALVDRHAAAKGEVKAAQKALEAKIAVKYGELTEAEIEEVVVREKWLARIGADVRGELGRVSQALTGRIRQLADRYAVPLQRLVEQVEALSARVEEHLKRMGAVWR